MGTDILIPLGKGSRHDNLELRYCLRSIEKHLKNVGNVYLVGEKSDWVGNIIHIPLKESSNNWQRAHNIYKKIMAGINFKDPHNVPFCNEPDLSDNFLFMNDDHYLLSDYDAREFPYYHRGVINLDNFINNQPQYAQMKNTVSRLIGDVYDFGVHCPILINKLRFAFVFEYLKWPEHGFEIKSMYGNSILDRTKWILCEDLKFTQPLMKETIYRVFDQRIKDTWGWFSHGDRSLKSGDLLNVLQELYPNKSKYEL